MSLNWKKGPKTNMSFWPQEQPTPNSSCCKYCKSQVIAQEWTLMDGQMSKKFIAAIFSAPKASHPKCLVSTCGIVWGYQVESVFWYLYCIYCCTVWFIITVNILLLCILHTYTRAKITCSGSYLTKVVWKHSYLSLRLFCRQSWEQSCHFCHFLPLNKNRHQDNTIRPNRKVTGYKRKN